jgi:hypothetical protein
LEKVREGGGGFHNSQAKHPEVRDRLATWCASSINAENEK